MRAFRLTLDNAVLFWELCQIFKAETEEQRLYIMDCMIREGRVEQVTDTPKTKEEYVQHLAKHFNVAQIVSNGDIKPIMLDSQPKEK